MIKNSMGFKDLGLKHTSENIFIRTLKESDLDENFQLLKKWNIAEEIQDRISDAEVKKMIPEITSVSFF